MKTWLKGGLWANGIVLAISIIYGIFIILTNGRSVIAGPFILFLLPGIWITLIIGMAIWGYDLPQNLGILVLLIDILLSVIIYSAIGAIIGWIVEKIRQKKVEGKK